MTATPAVEVREDVDGTDSLIAHLLRTVHRDDVVMRGEEWQAETETPYSLMLTQWTEHDHERPTGPKVRVTLAVHVEEITS